MKILLAELEIIFERNCDFVILHFIFAFLFFAGLIDALATSKIQMVAFFMKCSYRVTNKNI